jgi:hypothetical protein
MSITIVIISVAVLIFLIFIAIRRNWINKFLLPYWNYIKIRPLILIINMAVIIFMMSALCYSYAQRNARDNFKAYDLNISDPDGNVKLSHDSLFAGNTLLLSRLQEQYKDLKKHERYHLGIIIIFNAHYYSIIAILLMCSSFAAILLFFISKQGWKEATSWSQTIFLVLTAASVLYGSLPSILKIDQNISNSESLFKSYSAAENHIKSTLAGTYLDKRILNYSKNIDSVKKVMPAAQLEWLVYTVDSTMNANSKVNIGFDYTKATDIGKNFKNAIPKQ